MFCNHKRVTGVLMTKEIICSCFQSKSSFESVNHCLGERGVCVCARVYCGMGLCMIKHTVCRKLPEGDFSIFLYQPQLACSFLLYYKKALLKGNLSGLCWLWTDQAFCYF